MPTTIGTLSQGNATFDLTKQSARLYYEMKMDDYFLILNEAGVFNSEQKLTTENGTTVQMQNILRRSTKGLQGDQDFYSNATAFEYGTRTVTIDLLTDSFNYPMQGTLTQQIHPADLKEGRGELSVGWMKAMHRYSIYNQLGGNTATSITAPFADATAFTGSDLTKVTGHNAGVAPSSEFKAIGNLGAGSVTTDQAITSGNTLTLQDMQRAREIIKSTQVGFTSFNCIYDKGYDMVALVSTTGMNQLTNQNSTNAPLNMREITYSRLAGGEKEIRVTNFVEGGILYVEVPDSELPRGVHSSTSAEVANTRRAVLVGAKALDVAYGKGYELPNGELTAGFSVDIDEDYKPINKVGYGAVKSLWGCKKVQLEGFGANAGTSRDLATYVISHYSAT